MVICCDCGKDRADGHTLSDCFANLKDELAAEKGARQRAEAAEQEAVNVAKDYGDSWDRERAEHAKTKAELEAIRDALSAADAMREDAEADLATERALADALVAAVRKLRTVSEAGTFAPGGWSEIEPHLDAILQARAEREKP